MLLAIKRLPIFTEAKKKFNDALAVIRSGLQMQPDSMVLLWRWRMCLSRFYQYEAAIKEYEHILSKQPGSMIAANNLASLLSDYRNDKASLERAQALAASLRETQIPQFKDTLGWISYRHDDYVMRFRFWKRRPSPCRIFLWSVTILQ